MNREWPWIDPSRIAKPEDIPLAAERIEFFNFDPPPELAAYTVNIWYAAAGGFRLNLPEGESLTIESNLLDTWDVRLSHCTGTRLLAQADTLSRAAAIADSFVAATGPMLRTLSSDPPVGDQSFPRIIRRSCWRARESGSRRADERPGVADDFAGAGVIQRGKAILIDIEHDFLQCPM